MHNKIDALKNSKPGKAFGILKSMGSQPGVYKDNSTFTLPSHRTDGLNNQQCAEKIAEYFAKISQEYQPLDVNSLPDRVRLRLRTKSSPPIISELECYEKLVAA